MGSLGRGKAGGRGKGRKSIKKAGSSRTTGEKAPMQKLHEFQGLTVRSRETTTSGKLGGGEKKSGISVQNGRPWKKSKGGKGGGGGDPEI